MSFLREVREKRKKLADVLLERPEVAAHVDEQRLRAALDPMAHVGASLAQVERVRQMLNRM